MPNRFRHSKHLILLVLVFFAALAAFAALRHAVVPAGFGLYGHYRAPAIQEVAARPVSYAGREACAACHDEVLKARTGGKHERIGCESCHGALSQHAEDPSAAKPQRPDAARLCARCHEKDAARPQGFPQVDTKEHSGGEKCSTCHQPHHPEIK